LREVLDFLRHIHYPLIVAMPRLLRAFRTPR